MTINNRKGVILSKYLAIALLVIFGVAMLSEPMQAGQRARARRAARRGNSCQNANCPCGAQCQCGPNCVCLPAKQTVSYPAKVLITEKPARVYNDQPAMAVLGAAVHFDDSALTEAEQDRLSAPPPE